MSSDVERIKEQLSIIDVVSPYVKLEQSGKHLKGKSPFTTERTPSFFVSPDTNLFHCFSSQKGGDIFTFIQEVEGVDFKGALRILADKAGITLSKKNTRDNDERSQLYEIMDTASRFYEVQLRKDSKAVEYLTGRGLTKESIAEFRIGYAGEGWQQLYDVLRSKGYSDTLIEKAGLGLQGKRGMYDRFRERIMFPIADTQGRIVAFTGRIFVKENSDTDPTKTGKYINSPETPIYNKSKVLYGYDRAKRAMMMENTCVVVEGQMDVIMAHQAGTTHTVALSGTALTSEQIQLIARFAHTIIFALDADRAGIEATKRSTMLAYQADMYVSIIPIGEGKDPADMIAHDPSLWHTALTQTISYISYRLQLIGASLSLPEKKNIITQDIFPFINALSSEMSQDAELQKVSHLLGVAHESVRNDFSSWQKNETQSFNNVPLAEKPPQQQRITLHPLEKEILGICLWKKDEAECADHVAVQQEEYQKAIGEKRYHSTWEYAQKHATDLIFHVEMLYDTVSSDEVCRILSSLVERATLQALKKRRDHLTQRIRILEQTGKEKESESLLQEYQQLHQEILAKEQEEPSSV